MRIGTIWLVAGILAVIGGVLAVLNPLAASITVEQLTGWLFLFVGVLIVVAVLRGGAGGQRLIAGLFGLLIGLLGVDLLLRPLEGLVTLTVTVAVLFLASGLIKLALAWAGRETRIFWWMLVSGALSVLLAIFVFANLPEASESLLGLMLAFDLISTGVSMISAWARARRLP